MTFTEEIEDWVNNLNARHKDDRQSCVAFEQDFQGFYTPEFLQTAWFVVVDDIPLPDTPRVRASGLLDSLAGHGIAGITFDDTYYVHRNFEPQLRLHFHELVHVLQWRQLGVRNFIQRYVQELQRYGYSRTAPLEAMAYGAEAHYASGGDAFDVADYVRASLK